MPTTLAELDVDAADIPKMLPTLAQNKGVPFGTFKKLTPEDAEAAFYDAIERADLEALVARDGRVATHAQLLQEVWGPGSVGQTHYLRIYMGHLRHKLEIDSAQPRHFQTETGVGYRFQP